MVPFEFDSIIIEQWWSWLNAYSLQFFFKECCVLYTTNNICPRFQILFTTEHQNYLYTVFVNVNILISIILFIFYWLFEVLKLFVNGILNGWSLSLWQLVKVLTFVRVCMDTFPSKCNVYHFIHWSTGIFWVYIYTCVVTWLGNDRTLLMLQI